MDRESQRPHGSRRNTRPAEVLYGPLPDADQHAKMDRDEHLVVCCGMKRPRGIKTNMAVKATSDGRLRHHPRLCLGHASIQDGQARRDSQGHGGGPWSDRPVLPETKLIVDWRSPKTVEVADVADEARMAPLPQRPPTKQIGGFPGA